MSPKKENPSVPPDKVALYEKLVATAPNLEKKGDTVPYTSINGHMFSFMAADGSLALRLPLGAREEFLVKYQTRLREAYGIVMKEYVSVPEELLSNTEELKVYFEISFKYASSLKPKTQKKKGAAKEE